MDNERLQYLEGLIVHFDEQLNLIEQQVRIATDLYEKIYKKRRDIAWYNDTIAYYEQCIADEKLGYDKVLLREQINRMKKELLEYFGEEYNSGKKPRQ